MYESSGRLSLKLLQTASGNQRHETGLFDECLLSIDPENNENDSSIPFQAQYCTLFFHPKKNLSSPINEAEPIEDMSPFIKSTASFCLPSSCSALDLRKAVAQSSQPRIGRSASSFIVSTNHNYCYTQSSISADKKFDALTIAAWY